MYNHITVLTMGSIIQDMILKLDHVPMAGESYIGEEYLYANGGKGANQAVAFARLGANTHLIGKVGMDTNGRNLIQKLQENKVKTDYIYSCDINTGLAVILLENNAQNRIIVFPGANLELSSENVEEAMEASKEYDLFALQLETSDLSIIKGINIAKKKQKCIVLDAGPARAFPLEEIQGIEILTPNETETYQLTGIYPNSDKEIAESLEILKKRSKARYIVIKLGERGSVLYDDKRIEKFEVEKVKKIDSTAAGDAFTACMSLEYIRSGDIYKAIEMGSLAGTFAVQKIGAQNSLPTYDELMHIQKELS